MSFMPNPGSLVRLKSGAIAIVTNVTPNGSGDAVWDGKDEFPITAWDIVSVIHEPELQQ